jgi:DNA-binding LytR/AlgR family response regulator
MIRCLIIDDEPLARKGLKEYIQEVDFLQLTGEFDNPLKATDALSKQPVDLIFLDIQMPKITGTDFMRSLQYPPLVIFTTAYPDYALDGFELNAVDYLLKPFSFDRFLKAAMKAKLLLEKANAPAEPVMEKGDDHFFIKADNKLVKVRFAEILFAEALQNYVAIHTPTKKYISYLTFKSLAESLPSEQFVQTHKSFIVSLSRIESIEGNEIIIGQHHIPISRNLKDEVMSKVLGNKFLKR